MILGKAISPFALRKKNGGGGGNDPDAQAFITATGISGTNATATNQLVVDLKSANIWTKMKAIYPMVGGTATSHKFNLKNPLDTNAAFRLVFNGGGTFSANGYQLNGTNSYANTFFIPSVNGTLNSAHLSFYSRTNNVGTYADMGGNGTIINDSYFQILSKWSDNSLYAMVNDTDFTTNVVTNSLGLMLGSRTALNVSKSYRNGIVITSKTAASISRPAKNVIIGARNNAADGILNYSNRQCAFASIGDGLTDAEALALYNAVQTFNTTLARQV
jgi:hypothetical protein